MGSTKSKKSIYPFFNKRHDFETALIVDEGIKLQDRVGKEYAEAYMLFRGVKPEVIHRVLNEPSKRRHYSDGSDEG